MEAGVICYEGLFEVASRLYSLRKYARWPYGQNGLIVEVPFRDFFNVTKSLLEEVSTNLLSLTRVTVCQMEY